MKLVENITQALLSPSNKPRWECPGVRTHGTKEKVEERLRAEGYTYAGWGRWCSMNGVVTARIIRVGENPNRYCIDYEH